jgi:hypothetical protein
VGDWGGEDGAETLKLAAEEVSDAYRGGSFSNGFSSSKASMVS